MLHIPLLRAGQPYQSLSTVEVKHSQNGEPMAMMSLANRGLISRDMLNQAQRKRDLEQFSVAELIEISSKAGQYFLTADLQIGDQNQSPQDYVDQLSASTGVPKTLCSQNMNKISTVLKNVAEVLGGLSRGLDLSILDQGWGKQHGRMIGYLCSTNSLGGVLPSNSAGVHSLWVPSIALKVPLVLKPGSTEPWSPYRIAQAFIKAGCPSSAFSLYPTSYDGATEILLRAGRSVLYGSESTVAPWRSDPRVQIHGTGWSKILVGEDVIASWKDYLDLMITSVSQNSGRSCINTSSIWVPSQGRKIATALAERLSDIVPLPLDHPKAKLSAFANPKVAHQLQSMIERHLKTPGAVDISNQVFGQPTLVESNGYTFLQPKVIYCTDPSHPLANTEMLFPFVSVVETPQSEMLDQIGSTLVATALTKTQNWIDDLLHCSHIDRLNLGPIPTNQISWDQPHEGNLFELLYRQRAMQAIA